MGLNAEFAILLSVAMHVTWNLIARHQPAGAFPLWWVLLTHLVLLAPWGLWSLFTRVEWNPTLVALLVTSAGANAIYFAGLQLAYRKASAALVYPLVRSSPLLIAIWSWMLLGEQLSLSGWLGVKSRMIIRALFKKFRMGFMPLLHRHDGWFGVQSGLR
jgi:drug/metabolite transporter (DMT)-like permease